MAAGARDDNRRVVVMARDPDGNAAPIQIEHATGYVLVAVANGSGAPSATYSQKRDDNNVPAGSAVNPSNIIKNLSVDPSNDGVYVEFA